MEILTLSPEMKDGKRERELRTDGLLDRRVKIRNVWADLLTRTDRKLSDMRGEYEEIQNPFDDVLPRTGNSWTETRTSADGAVLQVDRYRDNGTLLVSDRQDVRKRGHRGGRRITLFDSKRLPVGQWSTARAFYHSWLDSVLASKKAFLISDSSFAGGLVHDYRRDNVILCQVIHSHFLRDPSRGLYSELSPDKLEILSHLDSFDLVVNLTDQQRKDMVRSQLASSNLRAVSNITSDLRGSPDAARDPRHGAMIARLVRAKRVSDAVSAIHQASEKVPGITLDVYGDGEGRDDLEARTERLGRAGLITFHGHTPGAKQRFLNASFSLLTSRSEGQGLVILESMAAGCIPIAYDIRYGPADIITDGVDGFLIRDGDTNALADVIARFTTMSENERRAMREAALHRASDFFANRIISRWGEVFAEQSFDALTPLSRGVAELVGATSTSDVIDIAVEIDSPLLPSPEAAYFVWKARKGSHFGRLAGLISGTRFNAKIPLSCFSSIPRGLIDISVDLVDGRDFQRIRVSSEDSLIENSSDHLALYSTAHGNLSARIQIPTQSVNNT
ncbi:glycosyltransferase [Brevibacterium sp. LE-L]|uniref:glycosyltransferase n=1 Tax=Brevibacterium sp. LE-L TaxID=3418557 RepID=UPI003CE894E1